MAISFEDVEWLKQYFVTLAEQGDRLPDPQTVSDGTPFYKKEPDGVYVEHIMFEGKWNKKIVDDSSQVTLEEV